MVLLLFSPCLWAHLGRGIASKAGPHLGRSPITIMNVSEGRGKLGSGPQNCAPTARTNTIVGDEASFSKNSFGVVCEAETMPVQKGISGRIGLTDAPAIETSQPILFSSLSTIEAKKNGSGSSIEDLNQIFALPRGSSFFNGSNFLGSAIRPNTRLPICLFNANCTSAASFWTRAVFCWAFSSSNCFERVAAVARSKSPLSTRLPDSSLPARSFAKLARSSMLAINWPDESDVRTALNNSPAIPKIKTINESFASLCLPPSLFMKKVNSAMNSPMQPSPTIAVETYPNHSQQRRADFKDATSESVRVILDHKKREERTLIICFASFSVPANCEWQYSQTPSTSGVRLTILSFRFSMASV